MVIRLVLLLAENLDLVVLLNIIGCFVLQGKSNLSIRLTKDDHNLQSKLHVSIFLGPNG